MADSVQTPSKRVCHSNVEEERGLEDIDRISDLPDSVLCHVLSFLPTKMSVATSVLSKRWIDLWTIVPALSFSYTEFTDRFVDPVYKVLAMFQAQTIHQFSLDFIPIATVDDAHIDKWISAAIKRSVQELSLKLNFCSPRGPLVRLHGHVFACKTLVCLKLFGGVFVGVPANVCLSSLRILQLERVWYANDGSFNKLLSSCPILEDLIVERAWHDNILALDINVPSLKRINVKSASSGADACELLINAPLLERIELSDTMIWNVEVEDLSNLVEAIIHMEGTQYNDLECRELIKEMGNVKFLSLSEDAFLSTYYFSTELPAFCNLVCLEITIRCEDWRALAALLKYSDNLKALVFHIKVPLYHLGRKCDKSLPETVQKRVSVSLQTLKLTGFCDQDCNWKLVRYVLKNAGLLKQMKIGTSLRLQKRGRRLKNLLMYPRASMACEIVFFNDSSGQEYHL